MDNSHKIKLPPELLSEIVRTLPFNIRWSIVRISFTFDYLVVKWQLNWVRMEKLRRLKKREEKLRRQKEKIRVRTYIDHLERQLETVRAAHAQVVDERDFLRRIIENFSNHAVAPTGFNWVRPQTPLLRPFVNHPNFFQGNGGGNHWWQNAPGQGVPFGGAVANNSGQGGYGQNIVPGLNGGQGGYGQNIVPAQAGAGGVGYFPAAYQQHGGQNVPGGGCCDWDVVHLAECPSHKE